MHFTRARFAHHLNDFDGCRAAHDRIVDQNDALAGDDRAIGAVLQPDAQFADGWVGWMKVRPT